MLSSHLLAPRVHQGPASRRGGTSSSVRSSSSLTRSSFKATAFSPSVVAASSTSAADTASYLSSVALSQPPARLQALCAALAACGASPLSPADRRGLHPLVVPLASVSRERGGGETRERLVASLLLPLPSTSAAFSSNASSPEDAIVGLLRVPSEQRGLQVVSCCRGAPAMELLARSTDELLIRLLAEEEAVAAAATPGGAPSERGSKKLPLAAAAGPSADGLLPASLLAAAAKAAEDTGASEEGEQQQAPSPSRAALDRALVAASALSPALCERLLASHLARRDEMSALITGEWYMRRNHFPGWARPYEHVAQVYSSLDRAEEARDCSRVALALPWWTLGSGFGAAARLAGLPEDGAGARRALEAAERGAGGLPPVANRDERQRALDEFAAVLDDGAASAVAAGGGRGGAKGGERVVDWPAFAERGASVLEEGGALAGELKGLAAFVRGAV